MSHYTMSHYTLKKYNLDEIDSMRDLIGKIRERKSRVAYYEVCFSFVDQKSHQRIPLYEEAYSYSSGYYCPEQSVEEELRTLMIGNGELYELQKKYGDLAIEIHSLEMRAIKNNDEHNEWLDSQKSEYSTSGSGGGKH